MVGEVRGGIRSLAYANGDYNGEEAGRLRGWGGSRGGGRGDGDIWKSGYERSNGRVNGLWRERAWWGLVVLVVWID